MIVFDEPCHRVAQLTLPASDGSMARPASKTAEEKTNAPALMSVLSRSSGLSTTRSTPLPSMTTTPVRFARSRRLSRRGRGTYEQYKSPLFVLVDRGFEQRYIVPAKSTDESTIRHLLADRQQDIITVYTDKFCAYDPLVENERFGREYVVHGDGVYADDTVYAHRGISKSRLTQYFRAFQLKTELYRKPRVAFS